MNCLLPFLFLFVPAQPEMIDFERPNAEAGPTRVTIGVYVIDIAMISDVELSATVDFHMRVAWHDPRMAAQDGRVHVVPLDEIWDPLPQIANERRLFKSYREVARVDAAGNIVYGQRYHGTITAPLNLQDFPLDRNHVSFRVVSAAYSPDEVEFVVDESITGQAQALSVIGFRAEPGTARLGEFEIMPGGLRLAEFSYDIAVTRSLSYFIWKVIVPLSTIVFMSWAAFWIDPAQIGPRLSVAVTSVLTLIAYRFLLGALLPRISYLTRLDIFILGATVLVFLGLVEVVGSSNVAAHRDEKAALRLDRWSRVVFPAAFIAIIIWAFWA